MPKKIVFLGIEGAGKTTLVDFTRRELMKKGIKTDVMFMGWKNFYNPFLRIFSKIYLKRKKENKLKRDKIARFRERSWAFYFVYYSELLIRYIVANFSSNKVVLMDRYFYDEIAFSKGVKFKFFRMITPRPDLCFFLKANAKTLKKRNEIFSQAKIDEFYGRFEDFSKYFPIKFVNSSGKVEKTFAKIKKEVFALVKV